MADPTQPPQGYGSAERARLYDTFNQEFSLVSTSEMDAYRDAVYAPDDEDYSPADSYGTDDYSDQSPAPLTDIPTSSTNVKRPRTVAAGYDPSRNGGTLTVMFRDGELYNYYQVSWDEWIEFHSSISKGRPYLNSLYLSKPRGPADTSGISADFLSQIQRTARVAQVRYQSSRRSTSSTTGQQMVGTAKYKVAKSPFSSKVTRGVNPSRGGRNPATAHSPRKPRKTQ